MARPAGGAGVPLPFDPTSIKETWRRVWEGMFGGVKGEREGERDGGEWEEADEAVPNTVPIARSER